MPANGHDFGIDTDGQLRNTPAQGGPDWAALANWRAAAPPTLRNAVFAGRYFNPWPGNRWADGENGGINNANLAYVFPLQGPGGQPQTLRVQGRRPDGTIERDETTVRKWGADDAKATCTRIVRAVDRNELDFPFLPTVLVYLDIEVGVRLNPNYWYGWASKVYWFSYISRVPPFYHLPFYPGLYCTTTHNPEDTDPGANQLLHRIPSANVQDGLTKPPNNLASVCYGIFATTPQTDDTGFLPIPPNPPGWPPLPPNAPNKNARFRPNFLPDWENRFDEWQQEVHMVFGLLPCWTDVPVRLWQFGMQSRPAANNPDPSPPAFNALNVDIVEAAPDGGAVNRMLKLR